MSPKEPDTSTCGHVPLVQTPITTQAKKQQMSTHYNLYSSPLLQVYTTHRDIHTVYARAPCPNHEVAPVQTHGGDGCVQHHTTVMQAPARNWTEVGHVPHVEPAHYRGSDQEQVGLLQEDSYVIVATSFRSHKWCVYTHTHLQCHHPCWVEQCAHTTGCVQIPHLDKAVLAPTQQLSTVQQHTGDRSCGG